MKKVLFAITALLAVYLTSCEDNSPYPGYEAVGNGSYFTVHRPGKGTETVDTGGVLFMKIRFKTAKDSVFIVSFLVSCKNHSRAAITISVPP